MFEQHKLVINVREESSEDNNLNEWELPVTKML